MNERSIFLEALDKPGPAEQGAFLDTACAGDSALRQRIEALLQSHAEAGSFLVKLAPERVAEELASHPAQPETQSEAVADSKADEDLGFLASSDKPGILGRLGHYDVLEVIGKGGMGVVLRAFDDKLHRVVAIKVMAAQLATNATARRRFAREAQAQAAVSHDHIVTIHAVEETEPLPYLVMQYVAGFSLQQRLDRDGPLELHEILRIGMQTASSLAAAHAQGLVHRDIKPANILLENGVERVKITDFGLARAANEASLTQSGVVAGTPHYMSPEQAEGKPLDQRTDLFSLGSVLYAMCTGRAPFRASGSMAVLRRVCEETPTPIRDTNPEIPDWLVAIIDRLHAKDPAERFQSAVEVADLLSRHLAHVQHPSVAPLPISVARPESSKGVGDSTPFEDSGRATRASRHRRWAVAAAILLCLIGGLSLTEATGVTNLRATVIRILTPDGTLVVETDDPSVKVTVEGDGGLVITGAGLEEIRLRPGSYRVHADRDGKPVPLDKDLVTVARGGRAIVKVKLERAPVQVAAKAEQGAFVLQAAGKERKFDTLAEAVQGASDGDTIEIRGNGPFVTKPIVIDRRALTIRAGNGFWPVIKADPDETASHLLDTNAALAVEGLEFQWVNAPASDAAQPASKRLIISRSPASRLHVANCRFLMNRRKGLHDQMPCITGWSAASIQLRNCQFIIGGHGTIHGACLNFQSGPQTELLVENCLLVGHGVSLALTHAKPIKAVLKGNTFLGAPSQFVKISLAKRIDPPQGEKVLRPVQIEASANIFDGIMLLHPGALIAEKDLSVAETEKVLTRLVTWREDGNLYLMPKDKDLLWLGKPSPEQKHFMVPSVLPTKTMADWRSFWGMDKLDSRRGKAKFQGGDLVAKAKLTPELLAPEDFRLRPDSDGYRAGKDGKDLGADVDLVGPGPAYERWKKTPAYQQWLKDTKQATKAGTAEPKAFVVLAGKGVEVRKFDTLAEAVQGASDGDTIEVRGNGPFVTPPVSLGNRALTLRAASGFHPVIRLNREGTSAGLPLLSTNSSLLLEGLELGLTDGVSHTGYPSRVMAGGPSVSAANCRFHWPSNGNLQTKSRTCRFRNCEFVTVAASGLIWNYPDDGDLAIDNCVQADGGLVALSYRPLTKMAPNIRVAHSTVRALTLLSIFVEPGTVPVKAETGVPMRLAVSESVIDVNAPLWLITAPDGRAQLGKLLAEKIDTVLPQLLAWTDRQNLYAEDNFASFVALSAYEPIRPPSLRTLADWDKTWSQSKTGSSRGRVRYQGGDPLAGRVAPEDFRLRPDSDGYRAGKDGKDLGADVDLVGPGPAYERWKKTPEYQQWLKETKQATKTQSPAAEPKAFVVLNGKDVEVRKFDTLAEAVTGASAGDSIEIRGNGPFVTRPITINHPVTIRAGAGFRPVLELSPDSSQEPTLLHADAPLVLEGLELRRLEQQSKAGGRQILFASKALRVANCRFLTHQSDIHIMTKYPGLTEVQNCEFLCRGSYSIDKMIYPTYPLHVLPGGHVAIENSLLNGPVYSTTAVGYPRRTLVRLTRNTFQTSGNAIFFWAVARDGDAPSYAGADWTDKAFQVEATGNVFDSANVFHFGQRAKVVLPPGEAEPCLKRMVSWKGDRNTYGAAAVFLHLSRGDPWLDLPPAKLPAGLVGWKQLWGNDEPGSTVGTVRFQGGDIQAKVKSTIDKVTPQDFRLRPDSAGYRAGKDGKDLGADVDLVGPGPAYERWKKTPAYQQWLKDTKQATKAEAPTAELKAFVVRTGKGVEVRKFDTLAEAVQGASDGDTIEIRGNGPFVSKPIPIDGRALVIRAGEGFRPVIKADPGEPEKYLLRSNAPLVLEGLDLQWVDATPVKLGSGLTCLVTCWGPKARLDLANCRFLMNRRDGVHNTMTSVAAWDTSHCQLRNCQSIIAGHGKVAGTGLHFRGAPGSQVIVDNCLVHGPWLIMQLAHTKPRSAILRRNTILHCCALMINVRDIDQPLGQASSSLIEFDLRANILATPVLTFGQTHEYLEKHKALDASEAERFLKKAMAWRGKENLFLTSNEHLVRLWADKFVIPSTLPVKTLDDWKRFWGTAEPTAQLGLPRFQGGDLVAKAISTPELLTPDDFRLRADSAGYRAGKDGKDLGADVDLVGPGPAYERWKKTPEYRQWLKDTKQVTKAEAPTAELKAFVVLTGKGVEVRKFDTLAEAVQGASDGDTIEVRGNGRFVLDPVVINTPLVIRAGAGFQPLFVGSAQADATGAVLIVAKAPLVLEGIQLQRRVTARDKGDVILAHRVPLFLANCRLVVAGRTNMIVSSYSPEISVYNCELIRKQEHFYSGHCLCWNFPSTGRLKLTNSLLSGSLSLAFFAEPVHDVSVQIRQSTLHSAATPFAIGFRKPDLIPVTDRCVRVELIDTVLEGKGGSFVFHQGFGEVPPLPAERAEKSFPRLVHWQERHNLHEARAWYASMHQKLPASSGTTTLAEWNRLWGLSKSDTLVGRPKYVAGNVTEKLGSQWEQMTARDFHLRPDSPGHRAGKDGKDLGADVDLVGPGPAYERWKKTPEYQQWLKDTGQRK